ncbi:hypothetical protein K2173_016040 [Erythroxylum novogranatense]|uniref:rRNA methyltransferase 1, mitochondrial n=1 Tax=Erythroxylum novogranatense TaxID=1862640 RepID=A0AAV8SFS0_9ROSI|nr:hypothetical protein K2173_016040 [Erythroxylum novogranatense]
MYSNLAKSQAFPFASRITPKPRCFMQFYPLKPPSFLIGSSQKPLLNHLCIHFTTNSLEFGDISQKGFSFVRSRRPSTGFQGASIELCYVARAESISCGFRIRTAHQRCIRSFSSSCSHRDGKESLVVRGEKSLPWLSSDKLTESKRLDKGKNPKSGRSSWEESAMALDNFSGDSSWGEAAKGLGKKSVPEGGSVSWKDSENASEEGGIKISQYKRGKRGGGNKEHNNRMAGLLKYQKPAYGYSDSSRINSPEEEEEKDEESDVVDDPRWYKIKNSMGGITAVKSDRVKPEVQRWNKLENWGRKVWKETTESTLPKMVGEGVYGVGPVLAALSTRRREFYTLYVQEGLDLSSNNRKKKDKKGFEKLLRMAKSFGLNIKEISKHDLNMVVDNRPHQGIVLDASPLEMVKVNELDPVAPEERSSPLWVALDEVTDPQNLGAIIRSAYYFGASGIVLCAKNSAPLSGVVSKASAGSLEVVELRYCKNMMQFLISSAENGWRVIGGSVSSRALSLNEILPGEPTILVLGSEGTGLRPLVERSCTHLTRIPGNMPLQITPGVGDDGEAEGENPACSGEEFHSFLAVESLNVSVAAGVLIHHLLGNNHNDNCRRGDKSGEGLE